MAEVKEKNSKKGLSAKWKTLKAEYKKIVWPTKEKVKKETTSVLVSTIILGIFIAILDAAMKLGIGFVAGIGA